MKVERFINKVVTVIHYIGILSCGMAAGGVLESGINCGYVHGFLMVFILGLFLAVCTAIWKKEYRNVLEWDIEVTEGIKAESEGL